jgi:predicted TIM-barrel fold metal-dependent hydrolase
MYLFDANCMLGRRTIPAGLDGPMTPETLLAEMDRLGIAEALVYHAMAVDGHPADGNERLLREVAPYPRLHPCWVLLPNSGEMPPPADLVAQMRASGGRAARLFPTRHRFDVSETNLGDLLAALEEARLPLFVDYEVSHWGEPKTDWRTLDELCDRYPRLPFIVVGESLMVPRRLFPFWPRHDNLYLETSYYQVHQGLSEIARRFGPQRLLFGTGLPLRAPGPPLARLAFDFLSDSERAMIGGENLRGLLAQAHGDAETRRKGREEEGRGGKRTEEDGRGKRGDGEKWRMENGKWNSGIRSNSNFQFPFSQRLLGVASEPTARRAEMVVG